MLKQSTDIDEIRLYIPKSYLRFPDYDGTALPDTPEGITLYRPAQDDDRIYDPNWAQKRLNQSAEHPDCAITGSG